MWCNEYPMKSDRCAERAANGRRHIEGMLETVRRIIECFRENSCLWLKLSCLAKALYLDGS